MMDLITLSELHVEGQWFSLLVPQFSSAIKPTPVD
jgi:hypothetical protein